MNCQHCQPLLLDHLYGLLDGSEAAAVDAHLAACPTCAAARAEEARVQGLFSRAAKSAFPNTRFEAPDQPATAAPSTPAPTSPATLPFSAPATAKPGRTLRIGRILPWAVAAAVLVAIPGTVIPVLGVLNRATEAEFAAAAAAREADLAANNVATEKAVAQRRLSDAEFGLLTAEQTQVAVLKQWVTAQESAVALASTRKLTVDVTKPATVQPGAPNDFLVVVNDRRDQWERSGKKMVAEVHAVNASDAVIFTQPLDTERTADKSHALHLPAGAWTKVPPDAELFLVVAQVDEKTQSRTELLERVKLAGPVFTTVLVTDKAAYRPGERLFFRSLTLDRVTFRPPGREQVLQYQLLRDGRAPVPGLTVQGSTALVRVGPEGKVEPVRTADGAPVRGVGCGEFVLPPNLEDGDYTLVLSELADAGGNPTMVAPVKRTVQVRSGPPDNYRKQIGFADRTSYAPGETVKAWAELAFQERPVANATVLGVAAQVDGHVIEGIAAEKITNANGRADFNFVLPDEILKGDARVKVTFRTPQGTEEVVAKQIPVVGNRIHVEFFPESGDTLAGVPCRVYVRATTPAGVPVDIRGVVTDGRQTLARVETLTDKDQPGANRGLAVFTYTPENGKRAWLKLESPAGAYAPIMTDAPVPNALVAGLGFGAVATRTGFPLPAPKADGVAMTVLDPVTAPGEPIRVRLYSGSQPRTLVVGAYTRGKLSDTKKVTVDPALPQTVNLMTGADPRGGVVRITVFEAVDGKDLGRDGEPLPELKPVAERLVFRKPGEKLNLTCGAAPAEGANGVVPVAPLALGAAAPTFGTNVPVKLSLTATDEKGNPAAAILYAAAVNTGAAPGPNDRLLPTHFLLAGEVQKPDGLEYADFLLTDHPKAAEALDLLLGTQGWRRFVEQQAPPTSGIRAKAARALHPDVAQLQRQTGQYAVQTESAPLRDNHKLNETFAPRYDVAVQAWKRAKAAVEAARAEAQNPQPVQTAAASAEAAKRAAAQKAVSAESAREPVRQFRAGAWYGVAGFVALALVCGCFALARPADRFPLGFSTLGSIGLAAFLVLAVGWGDGAHAAAKAEPAAVAERSDETRLRRGQVAPPGGRVEKGPADAVAPPLAAEGAKFGLGGGMDIAKSAAKGPEPKVSSGFGGTPDRVGGGPGGLMGFSPLTPTGPAPAPKTAADPQATAPGVGKPTSEPKAPPAGPPLPTPGPVPGVAAPAVPQTVSGGPNLAGKGRWEPRRKDGVAWSDIVESQKSAPKAAAGDTARAVAQADDLKRATKLADAYAAERGALLDAFFKRERPAAPEAVAPMGRGKPNYVERFIREAVVPAPLVVREYAAPRPTAGYAEFEAPDTVLWQPVIVLPSDGKATLNFQLGTAPGGYQVVLAGHTTDGRLGAVRGLILTAPQTRDPGVPGGSVPPVVPVAPAAPPKP